MQLTDQELQALQCFENKPEAVLEEEILAHWQRIGELVSKLHIDPGDYNLTSEISCVGSAMVAAIKQLRELRAVRKTALH